MRRRTAFCGIGNSIASDLDYDGPSILRAEETIPAVTRDAAAGGSPHGP